MKKTKFKRLFVLILSLIFISSIPLTEALACTNYYDYNCRYLIGGVGNWGSNNRAYYISNSASGYTDLIQKAVNSWVYTTNEGPHVSTPISIVRTTNYSSSVFDVYCGSPLSAPSGALGLTEMYCFGNVPVGINGNTPTSNWEYAVITLIEPNFSNIPARYSLSANDNKQATIAHEFGHAMGLSHTLKNWCIMCTFDNDRNTLRANTEDLAVINHLY